MSSKKNTGKEFEALTKTIFDILTSKEKHSNVELDVKLEGVDGPRQIDVLVESKVAGIHVRTIVEARDYSKRLDITHVDGLHSKMMDVKAHKAVLISRLGFSKRAVSKAERLGITLCTLNNPNEELASLGLEIPIYFLDVTSSECTLQHTSYLKADVTYHALRFLNVNGINLEELLNNSIKNGEIAIPNKSGVVSWIPEIAKPHFAFPTDDGDKVEVKDLRIDIQFEVGYLFGYVSELDDNVIFRNLTEKNDNLFFTFPAVDTLRKKLVAYNSREKIPSIPDTVCITCLLYTSPSPRDKRQSRMPSSA